MNRMPTFDLELSRFIRAPREKVFDAFVTREALSAWMCPRGMRIAEASAEAKVGGRYRVVMRARDGATFIVGGVYREIARPQRLVMTWQWEGENMPNVATLIAVTLSQGDGGTRLQVHHSGFTDAGSRDAHAQGWSSTLNHLIDLLDERGSAATVTLLGNPRSTWGRAARGRAERTARSGGHTRATQLQGYRTRARLTACAITALHRRDIPDVGRFTILMDPLGAAIGAIRGKFTG